ncbi:MAG TPA: cell envelope integrity protein TolA [Candidatus Cybelea sp.]|nr:cell envelope integrity protein TolA [Candidatus Cybelea sp.]
MAMARAVHMGEGQSIARSGLVLSGLLHAIAVVVMVFGLPWFVSAPKDAEPPVVVDLELAQIADKTNPPPPQAEVKPEPPKPEPAKPVAKVEPKPEPPKPPEPKPEPPKQAEAQPAPEPLPKPKETLKAVEKPPEPTPLPKAKPAPKATDMLAALLDKRVRKEAPPNPQTQASTPQPQLKTSNTNQLSNLTQPLTISELDAVRAQIERNWSVPAGARDAANLIVRIHIALNPDGTLSGAPRILDQSRMDDQFYRAAAESAVRAIYKSEPLKLPIDKYDSWRDIELNFNPKDMLGG